MALSMSQLHLLAQDDHNEMQHDFFGPVMLLALVQASHDGIKMPPLNYVHQDN